MYFKSFTVSCGAGSFTDQVLEIRIPTPKTGDPNAYQLYQPATVELKVTGSNNVYVEFISTPGEDESTLQGGMLLESGERYVLDFNLGLYKVKVNSATGSSTLRVNGMFYVRTGSSLDV